MDFDDPGTTGRKRTLGTLEAIQELARLSRLLAGSRSRVEEVYEFLGTHNNLGRRTLYLNLGYWIEANSYDDACEALARELARFAGLGPSQRILDVGFGFGDQDMLWFREHQPESILGLNVTLGQVELARRRIEAAGVQDRVRLEVGSGTATGEPDSSFDRVVALESAFHFDTREVFFKEAFRVLRPGGILALADLAAREDRPEAGATEAILGGLGRRLWQVPEANMVPASGFRRQLEAAGFLDVEVRCISEHVFAPFKRYARAHQGDPEVAARANPLLRAAWRLPTVDRSPLEYLLVRARRPGGAQG